MYAATPYALGVYIGTKSDKITTMETIGKLNPSIYKNASGTSTITVPMTILNSHNMLDISHTYFTIYVFGGKSEVVVKVSYSVFMGSPTPF